MVVPPLSLTSFYIQFPLEPLVYNHFEAEERTFTWSEKKMPYKGIDYHTCLGLHYYVLTVFLIYSSTAFSIYALFLRYQRKHNETKACKSK
jgi:hypothetical protein